MTSVDSPVDSDDFLGRGLARVEPGASALEGCSRHGFKHRLEVVSFDSEVAQAWDLEVPVERLKAFDQECGCLLIRRTATRHAHFFGQGGVAFSDTSQAEPGDGREQDGVAEAVRHVARCRRRWSP